MLMDFESHRNTPAKPSSKGTTALLNTLLEEGIAFLPMIGLPGITARPALFLPLVSPARGYGGGIARFCFAYVLHSLLLWVISRERACKNPDKMWKMIRTDTARIFNAL